MIGTVRPITITALDRAVLALERIIKAPDYASRIPDHARRQIDQAIDRLLEAWNDMPRPDRVPRRIE